MEKQIQLLKSCVLHIAFTSAALFLMLTVTLSSCNNATQEDSKEVAEESNEENFEKAKEYDAEFLVSAAEINLEEIQLGQLAQTKSGNADVKNLGKMMETAHKKALSDLQTLAAEKQTVIPSTLTENGQEAYNKLVDKQGNDFDKEYCDRMVSGHKDAISKFEKESTDATDLDIRNWATSMLPALRTHLEQSITCKKQFDKM